MRCFFCLEEKPPGDEHVYPEAIGGLLRTERVCRECNSWLGSKVDVHLTDHLLAIFHRSKFGLAGKSGKVPDGTLAVIGETVLADDPSQRIKMVLNKMTGRYEPRVLYNAKDVVLPDGTKARNIVVDGSTGLAEIKKIIARERKRGGVDPLPDEELTKRAEQAMRNTRTVERPEVLASVQADLKGFEPALLKIAYELACLWLGDGYLDDPVAARLRAIVSGESDFEASGLRGRLGLGDEGGVFALWSGQASSHIGYNTIFEGRVVVCVKVFDTFSAVVEVTADAARYVRSEFDPDRVRFVHIDTAARTMRHTSFAEEGLAIYRRLTPRIDGTVGPG